MLFDRFAAVFISFQHKLFYVLLAFGRFNLYANAYGFLIRKAFDTRKARGGRWSWSLEVIGVAFFWCWFGAVLKGCGSWTSALTYLIVSHVVTSPLHVQVSRFLAGLHTTHSSRCRLCFRISPCPLLILVPLSRSLIASSERLPMSYALRTSPSSMVAFISRSLTTSFRVFHATTCARLVSW